MRAYLIFLLAACGHDGASHTDANIDAYTPQPCWIDEHTPGGSVMLGTGVSTYEPMPDMVALEYGTQAAGYDLPVHAKISGLAPGNPLDALERGNPWTRFHVYFLDSSGTCDATTTCTVPADCFGGQCLTPVNPGHCGSRIGYVSSGSDYVLGHSLAMAFQNGLTQSDLQGKQVLVTVEVEDSAGHYAMDQKTVTLIAPSSN